MKGDRAGGIDVSALVQITQNSALTGFIDDTVNLSNARM